MSTLSLVIPGVTRFTMPSQKTRGGGTHRIETFDSAGVFAGLVVDGEARYGATVAIPAGTDPANVVNALLSGQSVTLDVIGRGAPVGTVRAGFVIPAATIEAAAKSAKSAK